MRAVGVVTCVCGRSSRLLGALLQGESDFDPSSATRTELIPYNAPPEFVEAALRKLSPLSSGVSVRRKGPDAQGGYTWRITLDWDSGVLKSGTDVRTNVPSLIANAVALGGTWTLAGSGVVVTQIREAEAAQMLDKVNTTLTGLPTSSLLQFRARAIASSGTSEWSPATPRVRTLAPPPLTDEELALRPGGFPNISLPLPPLPSGARMLAGTLRTLANGASADSDYMAGVGVGGRAGEDGGPGLVTLTSYLYNQGQVDKITMTYQDPAVYQGRPQVYVVPSSPVKGSEINFIDVKLWGAGGGGGSSNFSLGGAGAFVQGRLAVKTGDTLLVYVGGGGQGMSGDRGGMGGFNGGGDGGDGEFGGGGGGGASSITKAGVRFPLMIAAGGGGGGSTDYCCGHGGPGSGGGDGEEMGVGAVGLSPTTTPRDNTGDADRARAEFNDGRDTVGLPALHVVRCCAARGVQLGCLRSDMFLCSTWTMGSLRVRTMTKSRSVVEVQAWSKVVKPADQAATCTAPQASFVDGPSSIHRPSARMRQPRHACCLAASNAMPPSACACRAAAVPTARKLAAAAAEAGMVAAAAVLVLTEAAAVVALATCTFRRCTSRRSRPRSHRRLAPCV